MPSRGHRVRRNVVGVAMLTGVLTVCGACTWPDAERESEPAPAISSAPDQADSLQPPGGPPPFPPPTELPDDPNGAATPSFPPGVIADDAPPEASGIQVAEGAPFSLAAGTVSEGWVVVGDRFSTGIDGLSLRNNTEQTQYGLLVFRVFSRAEFAGDISCYAEAPLDPGESGPLSCLGGLSRPVQIDEIRVRDSLEDTRG